MVVPSQGLQSKSLHKWARLPRSQFRSIHQLLGGSYESREFPIVCSALASRNRREDSPSAGGEGFLLIVLKLSCIFSKSSKWNPPLVGAKIPSFFQHPDAGGASHGAFGPLAGLQGLLFVQLPFTSDNPHPVSRNHWMTNKTHSECRI